jgi:hypothetical protein
MSKYTWIVTRDSVLGDSSDAVGTIGPGGAGNRAEFDKVIIHGEHFRLLNDSGETQFTGYILGEFQGREPLDDYGIENGCNNIHYERDGEWIPLEAFTPKPDARSGR